MRRLSQFRWLIVMALVLGQYAALAHEYGGETHDLGVVCQVCLHHHQAKEFLNSAPLGAIAMRVFVAPAPIVAVKTDLPFRSFYRSRAPPILA